MLITGNALPAKLKVFPTTKFVKNCICFWQAHPCLYQLIFCIVKGWRTLLLFRHKTLANYTSIVATEVKLNNYFLFQNKITIETVLLITFPTKQANQSHRNTGAQFVKLVLIMTVGGIFSCTDLFSLPFWCHHQHHQHYLFPKDFFLFRFLNVI